MNLPEYYMRRALDLARKAQGKTTPNPSVGSVIVSKSGQILGEGHTQPAGGHHAEIEAINAAKAQGHDIKGSTLYVTLEPCSHFGRSPPCADAIVASGISHVVAAMTDTNLLVSGAGFAKLRASGIDVISGILETEAHDINPGFFKRMQTGLPWVRIKMAASLDGYTALPNGLSQWITGQEARADAHAFRARACAILTGMGTMRADDPTLTVRHVSCTRQPQRIVIDNHLEISPHARIFQGEPCWVVTAAHCPNKETQLKAHNALVCHLPSINGQIELPALLKWLGDRNINELHVEAGASLSGAFIKASCADELLIYLAPKLLGSGRTMFDLPIFTQLSSSVTLQFSEFTKIGSDLRLRALVLPRHENK